MNAPSPPRRGGRPTRCTPELLARLLAALADPRVPTKKAAAAAAGIGYQTLQQWQRARPELRSAFARAEPARRQLRAERRRRRGGKQQPAAACRA